MSTTPVVVADPMVLAYGAYEEDGKILFERHATHWSKRKHYVYYTTVRQLWRVYVKDKKKLRSVPSWQNPTRYIKSYHLEPVWPKHMQMDKGL